MAEINKAQKRRSSTSKGKYTAQYGITYNNKIKALNAKIKELEAALATAKSDKKVANIKAAIAAAKTALNSLKLKK